MHITNWNACRSGPYLTVKGKDEATGNDVKLTNVRRIEVRGRLVVAISDALSGNERFNETILRVG